MTTWNVFFYWNSSYVLEHNFLSFSILYMFFFFKYFFILLTQRELDAEAAGITRRQDESEAARKQLIELSREFKKNATEVRFQLILF